MNLLLDTDVLIEILHQKPEAITWLKANQSLSASVPSIVLMEIYQGCRDKRELQQAQKALGAYATSHITDQDSRLAMQLFERFCLSSGISIPDALVAAMAINRDATLLSFNIKHFQVIAELKVLAPYSRK